MVKSFLSVHFFLGNDVALSSQTYIPSSFYILDYFTFEKFADLCDTDGLTTTSFSVSFWWNDPENSTDS